MGDLQACEWGMKGPWGAVATGAWLGAQLGCLGQEALGKDS